MRHSVSMLIGASLLLGFTCAYNFDDQNRLLQRTRDMKDVTPMTQDEGKRLQSMIDGGRLKIKDQRQTGLPKRLEDAKNKVTRRMKKEGDRKHEGRAAEIPRDTSYTIAVDTPPKMEKGTKAHPDEAMRESSTSYTIAVDDTTKRDKGKRAHSNEATRSKPVQTGRERGHHKSLTPNDTGRKKAKKTTRHDPNDMQGAVTGDDQVYYGDDQVYYGDDALVGGEIGSGGGLSYVFMYLEGFQDARNLAAAIPPNSARPDEFSAGTVYIFNNEPIYGVTYDQFSGNSTTGITVDETDLFAEVTGQCIRTDPNDQLDTQNYVGRAYCQFVYTSTGLNDDVLIAEGPIQIGEDAILAVTGGRGVYRRTVGEMILTPVDDAALTSTPPSIEFNYDLDLPTSYYMQAYIYMDVSLLPPEVLS